MPNYAYEVTLHCLGPFMKAILLFILMLHWGGRERENSFTTRILSNRNHVGFICMLSYLFL